MWTVPPSNKCTTRVASSPFPPSPSLFLTWEPPAAAILLTSLRRHKSPWQTKRRLSRCEPRAKAAYLYFAYAMLCHAPLPRCEIHIKNLWKPGISSTRNKATHRKMPREKKRAEGEERGKRHLSRFLFDLSRHDKPALKSRNCQHNCADVSWDW